MASSEDEEDNHTSALFMNLRIAEQLGLKLVKDLNEIPEIEVDHFFGRKQIVGGEENGYMNYKSALCKGLQEQRNGIQMYFDKLFMNVLCERIAEQLGLRLLVDLNEIPEIEVDRFFGRKQIVSGEEDGYKNYKSALCKGLQGQRNNIQVYFDKLFKNYKSVLCEGIVEQLGLRLEEALNEIPEIQVDRFFGSKQIASGEENGYGNYNSALCKGSQGQINNIQMYFDKLFKDCKSVLCEEISEPRITFQCKRPLS